MSSNDMKSFSYEVLNLMPYILKGMFKKHTDELSRGILTLPQFLSLDLIDKTGAIKMKDIASELNISLPAATGIVDRLYQAGMVKRERGAKDRRVVKVVLTPKGKKVLDNTKKARRRAIEDVFGKLSAKERKEYLSILRKVKNILYGKKSI